MSKPQVLVFISWYAPGFKAGGPVRSLLNLVDHLRDRIDFHIVTSNVDYTETQAYPGITPDAWTVLPGGERVWYASTGATHAKAWRTILHERAWDVVYINGIYAWAFSIVPLWLLRGSSQRRVVAVRGMLAKGMMAHGGLKKRLFLFVMRSLGCYRGVEFQATNAEEVADVKHWVDTRAQVHLVPNLGRKGTLAGPAARTKSRGGLRLVSVARIAVEKNTLFAIERLRELEGDVTFDLFGPIYDQDYWQRCQSAIGMLPPSVKVNYKGVIDAEKVPGLLAGYHALFMPSQGENFGHTMAEALATGLPLLISDRTPWRGLQEATAGWDLPLEDPGRFTGALQQLIDVDQARFDALARGAFALGERYLNDPANVERSSALFAP